VLNNLNEQIRECLQQVEDCARKAAAQLDGSLLRQDFLEMEKRWLLLARMG
jgi:chemotaxis regulatin CheY-phosphate phosphatase CheZ